MLVLNKQLVSINKFCITINFILAFYNQFNITHRKHLLYMMHILPYKMKASRFLFSLLLSTSLEVSMPNCTPLEHFEEWYLLQHKTQV